MTGAYRHVLLTRQKLDRKLKHICVVAAGKMQVVLEVVDHEAHLLPGEFLPRARDHQVAPIPPFDCEQLT